MVDIQEDKYILLVHPGGDLTLRLRPQAPWHWFLRDILLDSFDHTFIFNQQSEGDILAAGFAVTPLLWVVRQILKKRISGQKLRLALALGAGAAILQMVYVLVWLDEVTITSKSVVFSSLSIFVSFILAACGSLIFFQARSLIGKVVGLLVVTFISWSAAAGGFVLITMINQFGFIPKMGTALYNHSLSLLPLGSFVVTFSLAGFVLGVVNRLIAEEPIRRSSA